MSSALRGREQTLPPRITTRPRPPESHIFDGYFTALFHGRQQRLLMLRSGFVHAAEEVSPPIYWAICRDIRGAVKALLNHGADLVLRDQDRNATPLDYAVVYARWELISVLISRGVRLDSGMRVTLNSASGGFEKYAELPGCQQNEGTVKLPRELGSPCPQSVRGVLPD